MSRIYTKSQVYTRDIDWFCAINEVCIHIASAGGRIPDSINNRRLLRSIQRSVEILEDINTDEEIHTNEAFLNELECNNEHYLSSFIRMAKKGFCSFDRTNICNPEDNHYHLVAWPTHFVNGKKNMPSVNYPGLDFDNPKKMVNICLDTLVSGEIFSDMV